MKSKRKVVVYALAVLVLVACVMLVRYRISNRPVPERTPPPEVVPVVTVRQDVARELRPRLEVLGTVRPRFEGALKAEVMGRVERVNSSFETGSSFSKRDALLHIDPTTYKAAVAEAESLLQQAQLRLEEERLRAQQARRDWERTSPDQPASDFTLRIPHVAKAEADVAAAAARLEKAQLDLERTDVFPPYECVVKERLVNLGDVVQVGTPLATIFSQGLKFIHLKVSEQEFKHLRWSGNPLPIEVYYEPQGAPITANLTRVLSALDDQNRTLELIAEVDTNLLFPGSFVQTTLLGETPFEGAFRVPQTAVVRETFLWAVENGVLVQKGVEVLLTEKEDYLIRVPDMESLTYVLRPSINFREGMKVTPKKEVE